MKSYDAVMQTRPEYANRISYVIAPDGKIVYHYLSLNPEPARREDARRAEVDEEMKSAPTLASLAAPRGGRSVPRALGTDADARNGPALAAHGARARGLPGPASRPGAGAVAGSRVRRVPHRSARRRRRAAAPRCRSFRATRSSASSRPSAPASTACASATASACRGSATPAARAATAGGRENLCDSAQFTGYTLDGGYAELDVADARYCFPLPASVGRRGIAPLLCAGLIGYRALRMAGDAHASALYGFGAAAHILAQVARYEGREVPRSRARRRGGAGIRAAARCRLGRRQRPAAAGTARRGDHLRAGRRLVPAALRAVRKGGPSCAPAST